MAKPTLKSIAERTGFSVTTVSRALAGYADVNEKTRELILEEARRQNYEPDLNAQLLQKQRSRTLGLVIPVGGPRILDLFFSEFTAGVSRRASEAEFDVLLSTFYDDDEDVTPYQRLVNRRRVDGIILARTSEEDRRVRYLQAIHFPFVAYGRTAQANDFAHIDVDGRAGQRMLTEHLIERGHTRIAYITAPQGFTFTNARMRGFYDAMEVHSLPVNPEMVIAGDMGEASGREAAARLLESPEPPTAIMTGNDLMAFGVMHAVQERGLQVGEHVAVAGFDDIRSAAYVHPGLTTVRQPIFEIGERVTQMLLEIIAGERTPDHGYVLQPELIVRASSGLQRG